MMKRRPKTRTYGTGSLREVGEQKWELFYRPENAPRRLSKRVTAPNRKVAEDELARWRAELDGLPNPGTKVLMRDLFALHLADMRRKQRNGTYILAGKIEKHLEPAFGSLEASSIRRADITRYIDRRLKAGAKPATVNRELSAIRRAFNLGVSEELLKGRPPTIESLPENNVRQGFVERDTYLRILRALPRHQQMVWCFAYYFGVRKGELLKLRWEWLLPYWHDEEPVVKVPGTACKSGEPHTLPLYHPDLRAFVEMAIAERDPTCPYLFQYHGRRLKSIRTGFEKACRDAGHPELIFHDTRRTAIREMERAGIPRAESMQITGHLTESAYKRYDLASEGGAIRAGRQMRDYWRKEAQRAAEKISTEKICGESAVNEAEISPNPRSGAKAN